MKKLLTILVVLVLCFSLLNSAFYSFRPTNVMATNEKVLSTNQMNLTEESQSSTSSSIDENNGGTKNPYLVKTSIDNNGNQIDEIVAPGKPPAIKAPVANVPKPNLAAGINVLLNVPAFYWSYGCSATSAAMLFGYYDNHGYSNMYAGPTNGGVCPMDNSIWGQTTYPSVTCGECPLSATHQGIDGLTLRSHVDDYWIDYGNTGPDPYIVNGWTEHTQSDCTGDFMGTNQSQYSNSDGSTTFYFYTNGDPLSDYTGSEPNSRDGCHGLRLFAESRGYTVVTNFSQYIQGYKGIRTKGFTFNDFVNEIDAGRPVLIQLKSHTVIGYGYNTTGQVIFIHDTWDYSDHTMTWGGKYAGLQQYGVTVIRLTSTTPTLSITTMSLPNGTVSVAYSQTLQAAGGTGSYTWSVTSGSLPSGLTLNSSIGVISGTPTTANTYNFTVQVTDSGSNTATQAFSITINNSVLTITSSAKGPGKISPSGAVSVNYGADQSFIITPGKSCYISDVLVDGTSAKDYLQDNGNGTWSYTFTNVTKNHTITVSFTK